MRRYLFVLFASSILLVACQSEPKSATAPAAQKDLQPVNTLTSPEKKPPQASPPAPPLVENFQGRPQLSLFPRAGAYRPEDKDERELQFWKTYIDHLIRTSGPLKPDDKSDNIAFGFRAIKGLDSIGFFSPIAVEPKTEYSVRVRFTCDLAQGAKTGVGLQEFSQFKWIGEQYPESLVKQLLLGTHRAIDLEGKVDGQLKDFTFTTGPDTAMIHLIFFRDGSHDRNPVIIDDIEISEVKPK